MKKVMTLLAAAVLLGACHCAKCTNTPNRSNTCAKAACTCKHHPKHHGKCPCHKPAPAPVAAKPAPAPAPVPAPVMKEDKALQEVAAVSTKANNVTVLSFKEPINFATNSDEIDAESSARIKRVANALKKYPDTSIRVAGYTDSIGDPSYNVDLSQRRAKAVALSLVNNGVAADKVSFIGHGAANPIATNKTRAGRAQNRRVELEVTNK